MAVKNLYFRAQNINMKKILYLLAITVVFGSCKRGGEADAKPSVINVERKHSVAFNVGGFQLSAIRTSSIDESDLGSKVDNIIYQVFNSSGILVKTIEQNKKDHNFGNIQDSLLAGTYTAVLVAVKGQVYGYNTANQLLDDGGFFYYNGKPAEDTFYKKFTFTVKEAVDQNVTLERIVGKLEFVIKDTIPENINSISLVLQGETTHFWYSKKLNSDIYLKTYDLVLTNSDKGKSGYKFSYYILNTDSKIDATIRAYDKSGNLIVEKKVLSVIVPKNGVASYSGLLFSTTESVSKSGLSIGLNDIWLRKSEFTF